MKNWFVQNRTCPVKCNPTCYRSCERILQVIAVLPLLFEKLLHLQGLLVLAAKEKWKTKKNEFR